MGGVPFRRPVPLFGETAENGAPGETGQPQELDLEVPALQVAADVGSAVQDDAAVDADSATDTNPGDAVDDADPHVAYPLSVDDMRTRLFALGISKSKDSIQRYCREGTLESVKLGMFRRYFASARSFEALFETLQSDAASSNGMQLHEGAGDPETLQSANIADAASGLMHLHAGADDQNVAEQKTLHDAAPTGMQVDAASGAGMKAHAGEGRSILVDDDAGIGDAPERERKETAGTRSKPSFAPGAMADPGMVEFLKDQIRVKDEQISLKDKQIAAMLERDGETNILIRNLQARIGDAFAVLVAGKHEENDRSDMARDALHKDVGGHETGSNPFVSNPHVENRGGHNRWQ